MKWKYRRFGIHVQARVYVNGALAGTLTFREEEFNRFRESQESVSSFFERNYDSRYVKDAITFEEEQ